METNISNCSSIEELFQIIDSPDYPTQDVPEIVTLLQKYGERSNSHNKEEESQLLQWNMDFLTLDIRCGELRVYHTPAMPTEAHDHLISRFRQTKNVALKMKYGHLLWLSPAHKHRDYAAETLKQYFELIAEMKPDYGKSAHSLGMNLVLHLKNMFYLSKQSKLEEEKVRDTLITILLDKNYLPNTRFQLFQHLLPLIKKEKKRFPLLSIEIIEEHLWSTIAVFQELSELAPVISLHKTGIEFFADKVILKRYHTSLADTYKSMINKNGGDLTSPHNAELAIFHYIKAGARNEAKEIESLLKKLTEEIPLMPVTIPFDFEELNTNIKTEAQRISNSSSEELIVFLITSVDLLPTKEKLQKEAQNFVKNSPFLAAIDITFYDNRGNVAKNIRPADKALQSMIDSYRLSIENIYGKLFHWTIYYSVTNGHLTTSDVYKYLSTESWIGQELSKRFATQTYTYNWLFSIMPAIESYFEKLKLLGQPEHKVNFIMEIDSITLKIEGMVRDFLTQQGITTLKSKEDKNGNLIQEEKDLNELLWDEELNKKLGEDFTFYLRFLLTEKTGYNLRNEIAHSLMLPQQYHVGLMNLLLIAVLKLGAFQFIASKQ